MHDFSLLVRQNELPAYGEGARPDWPSLKMGVPVAARLWDLLALGGFMFNLSETTQGTPLTGQAIDGGGIVLTAPALRFTVPQGITVLPRRFNLAIETAAGTLNEVAVVASKGDSFTSGGVQLTPRAWRTDDLRTTSVTKVYTGSGGAIVEAGLTAPRSLWKYVRPVAFAAGETWDPWTNVVWEDPIPIVGPASFLIYLGAAGTALTYLFSLDWAEVPSVSV